jgi:HK97 family phage major capsid protein
MPDNVANSEQEFKAAVATMAAATDEVKRFAEKTQTEMKNLGDATRETKESADKALVDLNVAREEVKSAKAQLDALELKVASRSAPASVEHKSVGQSVVDSEEVKALIAGAAKSARVKLDNVNLEGTAVLSATATWGATASVSNSLVAAQRAALVQPLMERLSVRDLIAQGRTNSNAIEYPREVSATNAAAVVAENTLKPLSDFVFNMESSPVRTIATRVKASRNILDDAPQLQSYIDGRLRYFVRRAEDDELMNGDGTGQHLDGLVANATAYAAPAGITGTNALDTLRIAALQAELALLPTSGFVLHPTNLAVLQTIKDAAGNYIVGNPQGAIGVGNLWGIPVATTIRIAPGFFLAGAFAEGAQIFDRLGVEVLISTEDEDNFSRNMVTIRAEERLALAIYRTEAFVYGAI